MKIKNYNKEIQIIGVISTIRQKWFEGIAKVATYKPVNKINMCANPFTTLIASFPHWKDLQHLNT